MAEKSWRPRLADQPLLWATAGAAALMITLRCSPVLLPGRIISRYGHALGVASSLAIAFALFSSLYRLVSLNEGMVAGILFAVSGFTVYLALSSMPAALLGGALLYLCARLVL
jgi:hypothetical protein